MLPVQFFNADVNQLPVYNADVIQQAFKFLAHQSQIEFNYPQGGCQQRAHIMSLRLAKKFNIQHGKVWVFAPITMHVHDTRTLFITDKNQITPNSIVEWNYHVAPVVQVNDGKATRIMVIDPSINLNNPILLEDWFGAIGNSDASEYTYTLPFAYFFNGCLSSNGNLTPLFDGSFFAYEDEKRNDLILEKGHALNDAVMKIYHNYLQPLITNGNENDQQKIQDLKDIFGNATALYLLFAQNISAFTFNTKQRYIVTHYSSIINETRRIFYERLAYWTSITNELLM